MKTLGVSNNSPLVISWNILCTTEGIHLTSGSGRRWGVHCCMDFCRKFALHTIWSANAALPERFGTKAGVGCIVAYIAYDNIEVAQILKRANSVLVSSL